MKVSSAVLAVASCMMLCALEVSVGEIGTLVHDGNHNAFPSICRFGNDFYLTFRKATGHRVQDGVLPVYRSQDMGKTWEKIAEITDSNGDLRDPRCVVVGGKLMIYSGLVAYNQANQKSWCVKAYQMNDDGKFIEIPVSGFLKNSFIWGVVAYDGGYVATAYVPGNTASLYKSRDGLNWEHWLTFPERGNEVSLAVDATGDLHCILRTIDVRNFWPWYYKVGKDGKFVTAKRIKEGMQGIMLQCVGDGFIVAGRHWSMGRLGAEDFRMDLFTMDKDCNLTLVKRMPSSDDCSYSFVAPLGDGKWYMVYYSQHNYFDEFRRDNPEYNWQRMLGSPRPADICFAILEVDTTR